MAVTKIPSLDALPLPGIEDDLQTTVQVRQKLQASFTMVGQILAAPSGLTPELRVKLNAVKFHLTTALSAVDDFLTMGNPPTTPAGDVTNLSLCIKNHVVAVRDAKPAWDSWLKTEQPPEAPAPLVKVGAIDPFATPAAQPKSALESVSAPTPLRTYLTIGGVAVGLLVLWKVLD